MGAGRTDTGVHAKEMYVHFDWKPELATNVKDLDHLVHRLNQFLDPAIRVFEAREVAVIGMLVLTLSPAVTNITCATTVRPSTEMRHGWWIRCLM